MSVGVGNEELDDILNSALEEFEEEELTKISAEAAGTLVGGDKSQRVDVRLAEGTRQEVSAQLSNMVDQLSDPHHGEALRQTFEHLSGVTEGAETLDAFLEQLKEKERFSAAGGADAEQKPLEEGGATEVDRSVAQTLQMLAENASNMEGMSSSQVEGYGEDMMNSMIAEYEKMGEKEDFNEVVDGMMRQLLSKELMYEPMKQVCDKYPEWLATQVDALSKEEYERYGTQYQFFQRIVAVYETEPDNFPRIMELMQDVQQYGQPPAEIIKELAPGLEFNQDGMPVMAGLGPTTMPSQMPGMPGIPFPENMPDGQPCCVS